MFGNIIVESGLDMDAKYTESGFINKYFNLLVSKAEKLKNCISWAPLQLGFWTSFRVHQSEAFL